MTPACVAGKLSLEKGDVAVSEIEMKVTLNGTNVFGMRLLDFSKSALPGLSGKLAGHLTGALHGAG